MKKKIPQQELPLFLLTKKRNPKLFFEKPFFKTTPWFVFLALIFSVLFSGKANAQTTTETFSTSGTWVCPAGVTSVTLRIWGGGGSGGGSTLNKKGGSGGGGGGYSTKTFTVAVGQAITYTIGTGGASTIAANGNPGQNSAANHIPSSTTLTANGGGGGTLNANPVGVGGIASGGSTNTTGANGGNGAGNSGGNGGDAGNAIGTGGLGQVDGNGLSGTIPGGGGGGGEEGNGGGGANGQIKITYATPPLSNDDCSGAIALTVNTTCSYTTYTNATATASTGVPSTTCSSYLGGDVWFSVIVPSSGILTIDTQTGVILDSGMELYSGTCGALTSIECDDDDSTNGMMSSITRTGLTPGSTIYIRFWEYGNDNPGTFGICATTPPVCVAPVSQASAFTLGTITTTSLPATFTGSANGYLVIRSLTNTPPSQPVNGTIYSSGNIATLGTGFTFVQSGTSTSISGTGLAPSTQYYYFIYAYNNTSCSGGPVYNTSGPLAGNGTTLSPPANDNCSGAIALTVNPTLTCTTSTNGTTVSATQSQVACAGSGADDDVWYSFTATSTSHIITVVPTTLSDVVFQVFSSSCAGSSIICHDGGSGSATESVTLNSLTAGTNYYIRVYSYSSGSSQGTFSICVTTQPACVAPVGQASAFILGTPTSTALPASFTGTANAYLVIQSLTNVPPATPVNGTIYSSGNIATLGTGLTFIQSSSSTSISGTGLTGNTQYYYFIYAYNNTACSGGPIYNTSGPLTGNGTTCPAIPNTVATSNVTSNGFTLGWTAPTGGSAGAITYTVQITTDAGYTANISGSPFSIAAPTASLNLSGLTANTTYYYRILASNGCNSAYVTGTAYTGYCVSTSTTSTYYIKDFSTTGGTANITNNTSGYSATGYGNFTAMTVSQQAYGSVNFSTALFNGTYTYGFNIWVDWNDDLDFDDSGEKVYASGSYVSSATGSITVPGTATVGNHRMRIRANYSSMDPLACGSISNGETEDYTFSVLASACPGIPTAVTASLVGMTSATISWTASSPAPSNGYQYYISTSTTAPNAATPATGSTAAGVTTANLTGLLSDTTYYVYVRNNCGSSNYSPWTSQIIFTTGYCNANNSTNTTYYISGVTTTLGVTNFSNTGTGFSAGGYANYTGTYSVSQNSGASFNITATHPSSTYGYSVWVDWNNDFDFDDTDENVLITSYLSSPVAVGTITIPASTPAGNYRMRIRNAYLNNPAPACGNQAYGETEDYTITALGPLPCAVNPTNVAVTVTSQTTATVTWTAPSPAPANGYQYYLSTLNTTPGASTTPTGVTGAGITNISLTGLSSGTTYYIWVRSDCGAPDGQGAWIDSFTFYQPNCVIGNSTGTTTLGCPSVLSGGLGLNGADPAAIVCTSGSSCVDLEATYLPLGDTSDYTVEAIAYNPPYQFGCLQNPLSVNKDDVWSPVVNLPFNFCYYGNTYNSCLIGSNGILSFNTSNAGGATGYSFNNNLPSTTGALFANTIYGVYHDIDPSKGGEVGWELITLNTGCRALVASWNDVPMYSNNTILYTGMMVLYENTNVIEVYIQEKNIDGTWNGGNAIVGVQNTAGTQAVVAPGRNGLDTDWTVTNEAWRFVPSGVSITSIKWHEGSGTSGPVIGTTDNINVCPTATTTYTAEVTYTLCNGTTLIESDETTVTVTGSKIWNGSSDTDWNKDINWTPVGIPNALDCVVIPNVTNDPIISGSCYNGLAYTLTIQNGGYLTVNSNNTITVTNFVNVNAGGTFNIKNSASLVQIDNVANTGIINMERFTQPMYRYDYTYWGSPVTQASGFTLGNLSPDSSLRYTWTPSVGGLSGNWAGASASTAMEAAKGYIVRAPDSFSSNPAIKVPFTANFIGTPNNGDILAPISHGTMGVAATNDKWNLLGNPYPSSVNATTFLDHATNIGLLDGTIYFWTHNSPPNTAFPDPFYASFVVNYTATDYASWNKTGGVGTIASTGGPAPDGFIAAGQSFFVRSLGVTGNAVFNNGMRSATYSNSQFFRQTYPTTSVANPEGNIEKHRIWLNLTNNTGAFSQILVGYVQGATLGWDRGFDGTRFGGNGVTLYSIIPDVNLGIQGRPLPFDVNDHVTLGYNAAAAGTYSIRIDHVDGIFNAQNIYLEDKLLQVIHDMKLAPYIFTTAAGNFNNRFVLRYTYSTLGSESFNLNNTVQVITNEKATVYSSYEIIKDIIVYDVLGRKIDEYKNVGVTQFILRNLNRTTNALFVKITLENGMVVTEKIIY